MYKFIFLIFLVVYVNDAYPTYDEDTAKKIFNMAASAYANVNDPQGNASINACLNKSFNGAKWDLTQTITQSCGVKNNNDECQGFIAVSSAINTTVLAFRGTTDLQQLMDELKNTVTTDMADPWDGGLRVNKYFYQSMMNMWTSGVSNVVTNPKYANYTIIITGHSLGGAIASLTAYQILNTTGKSTAGKIQLVTFGEPRAGDYNYATNLRSSIPYIFRVVHGSDPIPHLPFCVPNSAGGCKSTSTADYYQHPQEIWYHGATTNSIAMGSTFTNCSETDGEDTSCSDALSDLCFIFQNGGAAWHVNYFGHTVGDYATKYSCNDAASYAAKRSEKVLDNTCGNPYPTYDEDTAKKIFSMAASAYANVNDTQGNASINACLRKSFGETKWDWTQTITQSCGVNNDNDECQSFIAVSSAINTTVLAFRGTTDLKQLWDELKDTVITNMADPWDGGLRVNKYFYQSMMNMWTSGVSNVVTNPKYANYTIIITGHSLGGAIASLTAYQIVNATSVSPDRIQLVTFGEPRTGDFGYATRLRIIPYIFRVVHGSDPIPHLPFCDQNSASGCKSSSTSDYYQHPQEIWYHGDATNSIAMGSNYTNCNETDGEDSKCSDGLSNLCFIFQNGGQWHVNYFGHTIGDYATKYSCNETASYIAQRSQEILGHDCENSATSLNISLSVILFLVLIVGLTDNKI